RGDLRGGRCGDASERGGGRGGPPRLRLNPTGAGWCAPRGFVGSYEPPTVNCVSVRLPQRRRTAIFGYTQLTYRLRFARLASRSAFGAVSVPLGAAGTAQARFAACRFGVLRGSDGPDRAPCRTSLTGGGGGRQPA